MTKFLNFLHSRKRAQLLLDCENGLPVVKLHHTLGNYQPPQEKHRRGQQYQGSSRLRRRVHHDEARAAAAADQADSSDNTAMVAAPSLRKDVGCQTFPVQVSRTIDISVQAICKQS
jgi:hypothetical protein